MMLVLLGLCVWLLLLHGKWGRSGMGMRLCGDGWGWIQSLRGWMGMGTKVRPRVGVTDRLADISLHFGVDSIPDTDLGSGFHCSQHHEIGHFIRSLVNCYSFRGARPVANNGYNHSHNRISGLKVTTSPTLHSVV